MQLFPLAYQIYLWCLQLANKGQLPSVKAISKWERGLGLPDINSIEPLADALSISVAEVMQAERIPDDHVTQENASEMLTNAFDIMKQQRKLERKHHTLILIGV